ncbi:hypothetical protein ALI22I_13990 [Saccharothrix sp. ALI-22-I]|uniref:DUF4383 domain-containing protein n=1 Tax=Saccharothrix sp. ALI-22-I TaxID=1933778 RepID=UPI00097C9DC4|nr:DUF4383 domain-containing protein [Saccharothrix sp. ALI-22-I]ONI90015.1 hypothetical protein ALI22I_13990 [Saccharothrix sp. ALI-22-I]
MATSAEGVGTRRRPVQVLALLVGVVFLLVGVLGFVPGATDGLDRIGIAGPHSEAMLFGVFQVSVLHNVLHLLFGAAGIAAARTRGASRLFLGAGGFLYLLLWVYGSVVHSVDYDGGAANFAPFNPADNLLHLGLGAGMVLLAVLSTAFERAHGQYPGREQRGV